MATMRTSNQATPGDTQRQVAARAAELRELAQSDAAEARDRAWQWFSQAGQRLRTDREVAIAELTALFSTGRPPCGIDGETKGALIGWAAAPVADRLLTALTDRWLPWAGKRFRAGDSTGDNVLRQNARPVSSVLWPRYHMHPSGPRLIAFDFKTYVQRGVLDTTMDVLVIDYASVESNPRLLIKQIRDELVEVVPGANLGKMIYEGPGDRHTLLAYFALKSTIPAAH
jgi:hypothetical protein